MPPNHISSHWREAPKAITPERLAALVARLSATKRDGTGVIFTQASAESAGSNEQFDPVINPDAVVYHAHASADGLENASPDVFGRSFSATYDPTRTAVPPTSINGNTIDRDKRDRIAGDKNVSVQ